MTFEYTLANSQPAAERLRLAQDPATPPADLHALARQPNSRAVKEAVVRNPNTAPADLLHLAGRYWAGFLENPVLPLLLLEDPGLPHRLPLGVLRALVRRQGVPPLILQTLGRHKDREVREGARYHVDFPETAEETAGWQAATRAALARLPVQPGTLAELLGTDSVPDWLLEPVASASNSLVRTALFEASRRPDASPALHATATMLRRAVGEVRAERYHHDYGHGESVRYQRLGRGALTEQELTRLAGGNAAWQLVAAQAPNLPPALLERLARSPHLKVVAAVARHPRLTAALALMLASRGLLPVALGLARNRHTPEAVLASLSRATDENVRRRVARNPSAPPAALARLALDGQLAVRRAVAAHRRTPPEALEKLVTDPNPEVREWVGKNPACPEVLYTRYLLHDAEVEVRRALARHRGVPRSILQRLCDDPDQDVRHTVAINHNTPRHIYEFLNLHHHDTPAERPPTPDWGTAKGWRAGWKRDSKSSAEDELRMRRLYGHEKPTPTPDEHVAWAASPDPVLRRTVAYYTTQPDLLAHLATDPRQQVRTSVAHSKSVTPAMLAKLATDPKKKVRGAVAANLLTAEQLPDVLAQLAQDATTWVRCRAADNAQAAPPVLDQLARDPHRKVRYEVAGNPHAAPETLTYLHNDPSPRVRKALLRNASTPAALLVSQLDGSTTEMRHTLAGNENMPPEALARLAQEDNPDIRSALAYNKATPLPVLEFLWETQAEKRPLNSALARSPHASADLLRRIAADTEPHAMGYLLENPTMTPEFFRQLLALMTAPKAKRYLAYHYTSRPRWLYDLLLEDGDPDVLSGLAHERHTPDDVLLELARRTPLVTEGFDNLTYRLVSNNTAPLAVLETLVANHPKKEDETGGPWWYKILAAHPNVTPALLTTVYEAAYSYYQRYRGYSHILRRHYETWLALVQNPKLPTDLLRQFSGHPAQQVRYALLQRPDCPPNVRNEMKAISLARNLALSRSLLGRAIAIANGIIADEWLRELLPKVGWVERLAMLHNPHLPADLLATLTQDAHRLVRAAAQERAATGQVPDLVNSSTAA